MRTKRSLGRSRKSLEVGKTGPEVGVYLASFHICILHEAKPSGYALRVNRLSAHKPWPQMLEWSEGSTLTIVAYTVATSIGSDVTVILGGEYRSD